MQALSHYSYHVLNGEYLLCDLQGGINDDSVVLTDPVIHSLEIWKFWSDRSRCQGNELILQQSPLQRVLQAELEATGRSNAVLQSSAWYFHEYHYGRHYVWWIAPRA